jgi:DNA-binding NarL/FixJ family response regulator
MINLAIVDDHAMFRSGLAALISNMKDVHIALQCDNGQEFMDKSEKQPIDIVLLDLEMPELNGIQTMEKLHQQNSLTKVIILSSNKEQMIIGSLMELGAKGYLLKEADVSELERAVRSVHETGFYFNDLVSQAMLVKLAQKDQINPTFNGGEHLSKREKEVLELICLELTTTEIAEKLFLSPKTIENHRGRMMDKTGARNTAGLVVFAIKNNLVDVG